MVDLKRRLYVISKNTPSKPSQGTSLKFSITLRLHLLILFTSRENNMAQLSITEIRWTLGRLEEDQAPELLALVVASLKDVFGAAAFRQANFAAFPAP